MITPHGARRTDVLISRGKVAALGDAGTAGTAGGAAGAAGAGAGLAGAAGFVACANAPPAAKTSPAATVNAPKRTNGEVMNRPFDR